MPPAHRTTGFRSVADMWVHRCDSTPRSVAMTWRDGGTWRSMTWAEADLRVRAVAAGLLGIGLQPGQRCGVLGRTSIHWIVADLGILLAAGATTALHVSSSTDEWAWLLNDSACQVVFVETEAMVSRLVAVRDQLPHLQRIVVFHGRSSADGFVVSMADLEASGRAWDAAHPGALDAVWRAIEPDALATLLYTSGTTGVPKGVELTHAAWVYEAQAIDQLGLITHADRQLLFLPLAHVFAKVMQVCFIRLGVPTAIDPSVEHLVDTMAEVQPTWAAVVPRVLEKARARILADVEDAGPVQRRLFAWALDVGRRASKVRQARGEPRGLLAIEERIARRLVLDRVRARFGGHLRFLVSGGAPLAREVAEFFHAFGVLVCEGYGLTESAAASCVNTPSDFVFGTVGRPLPGCDVRIADDGEILMRSPGVMRGYHNLPDETADVLDADGWLHTGDIGRQLASGHVEITDRKKDLIITSGGRNVAPTHFQELLRAACPLVSQVVVHGDRRPFCSALVTLDEEAASAWAREEGILHASPADLSRRSDVRQRIQQAIDDVNRGLPAWEQVRRFAILDHDFTVENGLLTPSLKPRRRAIEARYAAVLDGFYGGERPPR